MDHRSLFLPALEEAPNIEPMPEDDRPKTAENLTRDLRDIAMLRYALYGFYATRNNINIITINWL
jgi:hypothetical protein